MAIKRDVDPYVIDDREVQVIMIKPRNCALHDVADQFRAD
jgi:hypothetical protein